MKCCSIKIDLVTENTAIMPFIAVSTKYLYGNLNLNEGAYHPNIDYMLDCIENDNKSELFSNMGNILESVTVNKYDVINEIKEKLIQEGAINALMSGSGPTVFAIFDDLKIAQFACDEVKKYFVLDKALVTTLY